MARLNKKKILKNYIYLLLDSSDSMNKIRRATINASNGLFESFRHVPKGQQNYISFLTFGGESSTWSGSLDFRPMFLDSSPKLIPYLSYSNYLCNGMTPLLDAVGVAVDHLEAVPKNDYTSRLILCITDGDENKSRRYNRFNFARMIRRLDDSYTVTFQVPNGNKAITCSWGIPEDNVKEWEQTDEGTSETFAQTQDAMSNYYRDRGTGKMSTKTFFSKVQSHVPANAARLLEDLSASFREYKVVTEDIIRPFVEAKTGKDYVPGIAFYQLMKPEKVQPNKEVLVQEKKVGRSRPKVYGGPQARDLIGLPQGEYAKVDPGNHGNYDVFVQSRSVNRILPRGTKVLVRV